MYCSECGHEIPDKSKVCYKCGYRFSRSHPISVISISLTAMIVFALVGIFGYRYYRTSLLNNKLEEAMGRDAGYTEMILNIEAESPDITLKELFELCNKSINNRTKLIIDLRAVFPNLKSHLRDKLIEFLNAQNQLVRSKRNFYQKKLAFSTTQVLFNEALQGMPSPRYLSDYDLDRACSIGSQWEHSASDLVESANDFFVAYHNVLEQETELTGEMASARIRFSAVFRKYQKNNITMVEDAKKIAQAALK